MMLEHANIYINHEYINTYIYIVPCLISGTVADVLRLSMVIVDVDIFEG